LSPQRKGYSNLTQSEFDREVARVTGESVHTISSLGFVPLTAKPYERDREPLMVDWDEVDRRRKVPFAV
jgi:hypothetical protein